MSDSVEIPVLEIMPGWIVDDVRTEADCNDAIDVLTALVSEIEQNVEEREADHWSDDACRAARCDLIQKRHALNLVADKRERFRREAERHETGRAAAGTSVTASTASILNGQQIEHAEPNISDRLVLVIEPGKSGRLYLTSPTHRELFISGETLAEVLQATAPVMAAIEAAHRETSA
ncbi:hypothetical protein [Salipiger mucosus]|uniref:Uncharacterized protein n=1 Tax=Salipiger mucosus DSM 16094 TaxID=1123237 RepID=S9S7A1_9RHOB|nr:hypothetical protein [Salipiger mucosus]EPX82074.1 hypothetical protein Salmuc_02441 [Salipiger mucosus DSM 16094]